MSRGAEPEPSERQADSDMHESSTSGSGGSVVRCLLEEAMGDEEAVSGASSSPPERENSPSSSERFMSYCMCCVCLRVYSYLVVVYRA